MLDWFWLELKRVDEDFRLYEIISIRKATQQEISCAATDCDGDFYEAQFFSKYTDEEKIVISAEVLKGDPLAGVALIYFHGDYKNVKYLRTEL